MKRFDLQRTLVTVCFGSAALMLGVSSLVLASNVSTSPPPAYVSHTQHGEFPTAQQPAPADRSAGTAPVRDASPTSDPRVQTQAPPDGKPTPTGHATGAPSTRSSPTPMAIATSTDAEANPGDGPSGAAPVSATPTAPVSPTASPSDDHGGNSSPSGSGSGHDGSGSPTPTPSPSGHG